MSFLSAMGTVLFLVYPFELYIGLSLGLPSIAGPGLCQISSISFKVVNTGTQDPLICQKPSAQRPVSVPGSSH